MRPGRNQLAKSMRQEPTTAEARLWSRLRNRQIDGWKFRRQVPFGSYVLDFYCAEVKLAIEVDGGQRAEERFAHDEVRTRFLCGEGVRVLRFWNGDVLTNIDGVLEMIYVSLGQEPAPSTGAVRRPLPRGER